MRIIGIDTSTKICGIGIVEDEEIIAEYNFRVSGTHSNQLMPLVDEILKRLDLKIDQMDAFAVASGPGMFTGLRIGVATVKGLGYALKKPIVGIPTLDLLANNLKFVDRLICPIMDARQNEVYTAIYRGGKELQRMSDYLCLPIEKIIEMLDGLTIFLGDATDKYRDVIKSSAKDAIIAEHVFNLPRGANVAMLGARRLQSESEEEQVFKDNVFTLTPLYIRKSQAEVKYQKGILKSKRLI